MAYSEPAQVAAVHDRRSALLRQWSSPRSSEPSVTSRWRPRGPRPHHPSTFFTGTTMVVLGAADGVVPDGTTVSDDQIPGVANSIQLSSVPCARPQRMPRATGSSSSSIVAGVPRSTRNNYSYSMRRSRSTAQKRKPPDGWPPPTPLLTCRGTRSITAARPCTPTLRTIQGCSIQ